MGHTEREGDREIGDIERGTETKKDRETGDIGTEEQRETERLVAQR